MFKSIGHVLRLMRAAYVLAREGVFSEIDPAAAPPRGRVLLAMARMIARRDRDGIQHKLSRAVGRLGPSYVKLGQFLATRSDVVGAAAARELARLQDRLPAFPRRQAVEIIESTLGQPIAATYVTFGEAIAAASIAQVHKARVVDALGERDVAVKVLRPGVERRFRRDVADMYFAARIAERYSSEAKRLRFVDVVDTLARTVRMEMDFRLEAAAASEFEERTRADADFRVPRVDWERTGKEVLTIEWVDGVPLSDIAGLSAAGADFQKLSETLIQSFLRHALRDGLFHADMHQGNLFLDRSGKLTAVDFGIMGRLGPKERQFLAEILFGFITRDYRRVAEVHFEAGYVPSVHGIDDFAQAIRAIGEPIHSRTADQISMAKLLSLLFEITALFDMQTRTELVMLQKTMVVVEGVARTINPKVNIWSTAEPVVAPWIRDKLGPSALLHEVRDATTQFRKLVLSGPDVLDRVSRILAEREEGASWRRTGDRFGDADRRKDLLLKTWIALALSAIAFAMLFAQA